jgi:hypothetical protein
LSYVIAAIAVLALLWAGRAWFKIARNPKDDLTAGGGGKPQTKRLKKASRLIAVALGLSALAAVFAIIGGVL